MDKHCLTILIKQLCIMSVQYTRGCAVQQGMLSTLGGYLGVFSTLGDIMSTPGDIMINVEPVELLYGNHSVLDTPCCTHDILPLYSCRIPQCTKHPQCTHNIPQCTEHPLTYSIISPGVQCTSPGVLHRHYAG